MTGNWIVAVDDDPTGCQSVADVPLVTSWDHDTLQQAARHPSRTAFVLTNSRSMTEQDACAVNRAVGTALGEIARSEGLSLRLISRGDSTLRGHFPAEVDALTRASGVTIDATILCPAFFDAGRVTLDGIHWLIEPDGLQAVRDSEYARDPTFGYSELRLVDWAMNRGDWTHADIVEIATGTLEEGSVETVRNQLLATPPKGLVVLNACNHRHLEVFVDALEQAEAAGRSYVCRTAPSFVRARTRRPAAPNVNLTQMAAAGRARNGRGLVVVGSHTDLTNSQVTHLAKRFPDIVVVDFDAEQALTDAAAAEEATTRLALSAAERGDLVLCTSRRLVGGSGYDALSASRHVADVLGAVVQRVADAMEPAWIVAKGGITSHVTLTRGLGIRSSVVKGPALGGLIPVLDVGDDVSRPFVIFPGNVGSEPDLADVVARLRGQE